MFRFMIVTWESVNFSMTGEKEKGIGFASHVLSLN